MLPVAAVLAAGAGLVWIEGGSIAPVDWLPYAAATALLAAVVLLAGAAARPSGLALAGVAGLVALAAWSAVSIAWAPLRAEARDEGLLVLFYGLALAVPLLTLRTARERLRATELFVAVIGATALAVAFEARFGDGRVFVDGRLGYPVSYANALAAFFLLAFWPAVVVAARRSAAPAVRAAAVCAGALVVGAWVATQSKGAGLGLAVSAVVFFAAYRDRLRAAVPVVLAAGTAFAAFEPLTAPYRDPGAVRDAGAALLAVAVAAAIVGAVYALVDRRIVVPPARARLLGRLAAAGLAVLAIAGVVAALWSVGSPRRWAADQWETFKTNEAVETRTHLADVGSNRYDFWRVAVREFADHPFAGVGARGFTAIYLQRREAHQETPRRSHSLVLDTLMELGVVGFVLLVVGVGAPLAAAARRAVRPSAAAALAGGTLWLTDAAVDWIWTLPAAGIPFFVLLGIGASADAPPVRRPRLLATAAAAAAVLLFVPAWLSARIVARADEPGDLRAARVLDPVSAQPVIAEARLTPSPANLAVYADAVEREPQDWFVRYEYGLALFAAGRNEAAGEQFSAALRLWPRHRAIEQALRMTR